MRTIRHERRVLHPMTVASAGAYLGASEARKVWGPMRLPMQSWRSVTIFYSNFRVIASRTVLTGNKEDPVDSCFLGVPDDIRGDEGDGRGVDDDEGD